MIFCRPHLLSVSGETWCGSYSSVACAEKNIKKIMEKRKSKSTRFCTSAFLALLVQYLRYCHSDCSVSFFHCSLFQLVVLRLGHVLASNCDLYFEYLMTFVTMHSLFATPCYIFCLSHSSTYTSVSTGSSCNCYTQLDNKLYRPVWLW